MSLPIKFDNQQLEATATKPDPDNTTLPPHSRTADLSKHCKYYSTGGICAKENKCRFVHDLEVRKAALTMAPATTTPQLDCAVGPATEPPTGLQPQPLGISENSKLQLAKPLSQKARRIVRNKTEKLIRKRDQVDKALQRECAREEKSLRPKDYLTRSHIVKLDDALARREARHLRARTRAIQERERLYKWDPSTERQIDLDLLNKYLFKFKRHLGSSLPDRELPLKPGEFDDDTSSDSSCGDEADGRADVAFEPPTGNTDSDSSDSDSSDSDNSDSNNSDSDSDEPDEGDSDDGSSKGDKDKLYASPDGVADQIPEDSKKRKLIDGPSGQTTEQAQRKKAKKEQAATAKHDATTSGSQCLPPSVSKFTQNKEDGHSGEQASIDNMPQSKKLPKIMINGESAAHNTANSNPKNATVNDKTADITASDYTKASGGMTTCNKIPPRSPVDNTAPLRTGNAPVSLPWYQLHAKRQLQDDFNDFVRSKPNPRRAQGHKMYYMSGPYDAVPRPLVNGDLPSPQTSSSPSSQFPTAGTQTKTAHKSERDGLRKNKTQQKTPQSRRVSHSSPVPAEVRSTQASTQMTGT